MSYLAKPERRGALLRAAIAILRREGLARVTTRAVAAEAKAAAGIVHHHFASGETLRAEAFRRLLEEDLARLDAALTEAAPEALAALIVDELVPGAPDDAHWRLWCEAWDVARTDAAIAAVYADAVTAWHARLTEVLGRLAAPGGKASRRGGGVDARAAAWRLLALADGLAGFVLSQPPILSAAEARRLVVQALVQELPPSDATPPRERGRPP